MELFIFKYSHGWWSKGIFIFLFQSFDPLLLISLSPAFVPGLSLITNTVCVCVKESVKVCAFTFMLLLWEPDLQCLEILAQVQAESQGREAVMRVVVFVPDKNQHVRTQQNTQTQIQSARIIGP